MKNFFLLLIFISIFSCKKSSKNSSQIEKKYLGIEDIPNSETKYKIIKTENTTDNFKLLNSLKSKLDKANFNFTEEREIRKISYNNCEENIILNINGSGIRQYFIRSRKPEKPTNDTYADFTIWVYEFSTTKIAQQNYDLLEKAFNSKGRFCNGKAPEKIVINGNEVFHLSSRAEMFRTYTEKYGEIIKNYR